MSDRARDNDRRDAQNSRYSRGTQDERHIAHGYGEREENQRSRRRSRSPPAAAEKCRWDDPVKQFSEKHKPEKPPKHRAPPNRFNIPPGRQWDGMDRSNGFEVAYFKKLAQQERKKDLDYKYTVADM